MTDTQPTQPFARYVILFDRAIGEEDHQEFHYGDGEAAVAQLAKELQETIDSTGLPVGHFKIIMRTALTDPAAMNVPLPAPYFQDDPDELRPMPPICADDPWHVLHDALNLLENTMDDDVSPWEQYPGDGSDPKATRSGYIMVIEEARKIVEGKLDEKLPVPPPRGQAPILASPFVFDGLRPDGRLQWVKQPIPQVDNSTVMSFRPFVGQTIEIYGALDLLAAGKLGGANGEGIHLEHGNPIPWKDVEQIITRTQPPVDPPPAPPWPFGKDGRILTTDFPPIRSATTSTGGYTRIPPSDVRRGLLNKQVLLVGGIEELTRGKVEAIGTESIDILHPDDGKSTVKWVHVDAIWHLPTYLRTHPEGPS